MNEPAQFWADPRLVYTVAIAAVALLLIALWLFGRRQSKGRQAAVICLMLSIGLHVALMFLVPMMSRSHGGAVSDDLNEPREGSVSHVEFSTFDPDLPIADSGGLDPESAITPLPVSDLTDLLQQHSESLSVAEVEQNQSSDPDVVPEVLAPWKPELSPDLISEIDSELGDMLEDAFASDSAVPDPDTPDADADLLAGDQSVREGSIPPIGVATAIAKAPGQLHDATSTAPPATVPGALENDFASRVGKAKEVALAQTGGNANTEAAVEAALRFLASSQRSDGAWDPRATGAGRESGMILGVRRPGTGSQAETAITGLALLTLMGAGQTHHQGDYADNVYRGLAFLIRTQKPTGSLAGNASPYAANYSHGMAALAMCEAAAITQDASAIDSAKNAIRYTLSQQHPSTGGWRYLPNDPGDLSQLGWQAMVIDAGHRAKIPVNRQAVSGIQRFLRSVRAGQSGGLASYRRGERPSRTMTAEALATRLLIGEQVPKAEVTEAQRYLLQQPPGVGKDNYYYWYYATVALHQLQDDAWKRWNEALQQRLLTTQQGDGSWSSRTMWGGYGGTVYSTSMAALCLEAYYRHAIRSDAERIANRP